MERTHRTLELARSPRSMAEQQPSPPPGGADAQAIGPRSRTVQTDRIQLRERRVVFPTQSEAAARAFRMLRTQVLRTTRTESMRIVGIVSAADGEGKTLTAVNLALSVAAEPNQTALLVDLDLRRPQVASLLGLNVTAGLEDWFESSASLDELFVRLEGVDRLRVLPTMRPVEGSSELLAGTRTRALIAELRDRYTDRLVLVDLPPALLADDLLTIAPLLDGVLLVLCEGRTKRSDVGNVKEMLKGTRIIGSVLNRSKEFEQRPY